MSVRAWFEARASTGWCCGNVLLVIALTLPAMHDLAFFTTHHAIACGALALAALLPHPTRHARIVALLLTTLILLSVFVLCFVTAYLCIEPEYLVVAQHVDARQSAWLVVFGHWLSHGAYALVAVWTLPPHITPDIANGGAVLLGPAAFSVYAATNPALARYPLADPFELTAVLALGLLLYAVVVGAMVGAMRVSHEFARTPPAPPPSPPLKTATSMDALFF